MHEALVEDAEHDVDGQPAPPGSATAALASDCLEGLCRALEPAVNRGGHADVARGAFDGVTASPSDTPGARLNDSVTAGNCPWWLTASGVVDRPKWANARKRHQLPGLDAT